MNPGLTPPESYYAQSSERLNFRRFTPSDWQQWLPFFPNNPSLRFVGQADDRPDEEKAKSWIGRQIERMESGEFGQLAVYLKETGEFIGLGGLIGRDLEDGPVLEVTYSLLSSHHGKGYATELALHFLDNGFDTLKQDRMISLIHTENVISMRVAEKNGLQRTKEIEFMGFQVFVYEIQRVDFFRSQ